MKTTFILLFTLIISQIALGQNVGIGTTTPSSKLEIYATPIVKLKLKSNSYLDTSQIIFSNKAGIYGTDILMTSIREQGLQFSSQSDLFGNNVSNILAIKPTGIVTIGNVVSPTYKLEVEGNIGLRGTNLFEFGKGISGKETNAGKIGYNAFGQNALTIVGAGTTILNRAVYFYAEGGTVFNGSTQVIGNSQVNGNALVIGTSQVNSNALVIGNSQVNGNVMVGVNSVPSGYRVAVDGKIIAEEMRIQNSTAWPDYVFKEDYRLKSLQEVENHIAKFHHLPDVPSAAVVNKEGFQIGEMQNILLKKIEELTLYILQQEKRIQELELQSSNTNR